MSSKIMLCFSKISDSSVEIESILLQFKVVVNSDSDNLSVNVAIFD